MIDCSLTEDQKQRYSCAAEFVRLPQVMAFAVVTGVVSDVKDTMLYASICSYGDKANGQSEIQERLIKDGSYEKILFEVRNIIKEKCQKEWRRLEQAN